MNQPSIFELSSYFFNPHAIPYFIAGLVVFLEGIFVYLQNRKSSLQFAFSLIGLTTALWLTGVGIFYSSVYEEIALVWTRRYCFLGVIFIAPCVHLFSACWRKTLFKQWFFIALNFLCGVIFYYFSVATDLFIRGMWHYPWGFYTQSAILNPISQVWFFSHMTFGLLN